MAEERRLRIAKIAILAYLNTTDILPQLKLQGFLLHRQCFLHVFRKSYSISRHFYRFIRLQIPTAHGYCILHGSYLYNTFAFIPYLKAWGFPAQEIVNAEEAPILQDGEDVTYLTLSFLKTRVINLPLFMDISNIITRSRK